MASLQQSLRDNVVWATGYVQGRSFALPRSFGELYALLVSKITSLVALPLPFLSFLALPFYAGSSTTMNLVFFYLTWSAIVLSHDELTVELYGNLAVRFLCFFLPALGFLAFDCAVPGFSRGMKNRGQEQLPLRFGRNKVLEVIGVAFFNVLLGIALQAGLELLATEVFHVKSILKVTSVVPLPWTILKDVAKGFAVRGVLHYACHRYLLHTWDSPLKSWHGRWQHSVSLPFSLVAAYDHPVNYLLAQWLPVFLPAYLFRFHVLTWHLLLALCSLEDLFVYSGYAVLPSSIVLVGMARRTDEHFATASNPETIGNFGHSGVLDLICGTTCQSGGDVVDDAEKEADKHHLQDRAENAVDGASNGIKSRPRKPKGRSDVGNEKGDSGDDKDDELEAVADADDGADNKTDDSPPPPTRRKSERRKGRNN